MPSMEAAVRGVAIIQMTGEADFPCIRFHDYEISHYLYGELYSRSEWDTWKVGDIQQ